MWLILTGLFCALSAATSILWAMRANSAARRAERAPASLLARVASCESRIESLTTSRDELTVALDALAQRVKMQRVRQATDHATGPRGLPDPYKEPDRWREAMNAQIARGKLGAA
jgi:hypothetical protein